MEAVSFYKIEDLNVKDHMITSRLSLHPGHDIFKGHFPGMPVLPGVCMLEIVKGVLEKVLGKKSDFKKSHQMKFLNIIDPNTHPEVIAELKWKKEKDEVKVVAKIYFEDIIFYKMDASFALLDN